MVHGRNVTSRLDCNGLARFDRHCRKGTCFRAYLVGCNGTDGINDPSVVTQTVNFLPGAVDPEFAVVLDQRGGAKVEGAQAVLNNIGLKNGSSFTEKRLS